MILGPLSRSSVVFATRRKCCCIKFVDGTFVGSVEREARKRLPPFCHPAFLNPKLPHAVPVFRSKSPGVFGVPVHLISERCQCRHIKSFASRKIRNAQRDVIEHTSTISPTCGGVLRCYHL